MKLNLSKTIAIGSMLGAAVVSAPVLVADGDAMQTFARDVKAMAMTNKDGMVSKKEFRTMMDNGR